MTTPDDEVAHTIDVDDAQTKFYKQHARRSERPQVSGRSTIYDFDEWASKTITESFQKIQEIKRNKEIDNLARREQDVTNHVMQILCGILLILVIMFSVICAIDDQESRQYQTNAIKKDK